MLPFRLYITELLDKPLPWKWTRQNDRAWVAQFKAPNDVVYDMDFDYFTISREGEGPGARGIELTFAIDAHKCTPEVVNKVGSTFGVTGTGSEVEVFATVADIFRSFIRTRSTPPWEYLAFTATGSSRQRLYDTLFGMIKRSLPSDFKTDVHQDHRFHEKVYKIMRSS